VSDTSGPPWLAERATHMPLTGPEVDVVRLERRVEELERLVANQMQRGVEFPPPFNEESEVLKAFESSQPCCAKRKALEAMYAAYGPEPFQVVVADLERHWHLRGHEETVRRATGNAKETRK